MNWFDFERSAPEEPGGILELPEHEGAGFALELHVYVQREGTFALWFLDNGKALRHVIAARA